MNESTGSRGDGKGASVRVWIATLAVFLTVATAAWATHLWHERRQVLAVSEVRLTVLARLMRAHAERSIEVANDTLRDIEAAYEYRDTGDAAAMRAAWDDIRALIAPRREIGSAWILDAAGNNLLNSSTFPAVAGNFAHRDYFAGLRGEATTANRVRPARAGRVTGRERFTVSRAIRGPDGAFRGVAVVGVYSDYFAGLYMEASAWPGVTLSLRMANDGQLLGGWPEGARAFDKATLATLLGQAAADRQGVAMVEDGTNAWVTAWNRLSDLPVVAVARQHRDAALAPWRRLAAWTGMALLLATLGFSALVALGLRSARAESRAARQLRDANRELDRRVEERTASLSQALERNRTLLGEVNHRTKNNLQLVSSMIAAQARSAAGTDMRGELRDLQHRIRAIGQVHERIYRTGDFETVDVCRLLGELCDDVVRLIGADRTVDYEGYGIIPIRAERAVNIMLVVNELVTNALKHADHADTRVTVRCSQACGELVVSVRDNGAGLPPGFDLTKLERFGLRMAQLLVRQEGGRLIARSEDGAVFELRVPLDAAAESPPAEAAE